MDIKFIAGKEDGQKWNDKDLPHLNLVYMHIRANDESFSGWVSPDVRRLVNAAPDNQRKVYEYEKLIAKLYKLLPGDPDSAYDLVRAEHLAIHGPSDN